MHRKCKCTYRYKVMKMNYNDILISIVDPIGDRLINNIPKHNNSIKKGTVNRRTFLYIYLLIGGTIEVSTLILTSKLLTTVRSNDE